MPDNRRQTAAPVEDGDEGAPAATIVAIPKSASQTKAEQRADPRAKAERIGDALRRARVARNEDLYHIAEYLCIKPAFLIALENSRYDEFPADAYVIGFLRTYATFLGVDSRDAVDRYRVEMAGSRKKPILAMPIPLTEGRAPSGLIVAGAIAALLILYAVWYSLSSTNRTEVSVPPPTLPSPTAPVAAVPAAPAPVENAIDPAAPVPLAPATTVASVPAMATPAVPAAPVQPSVTGSGTIPPAAPGIVLTAAAPPAVNKAPLAAGPVNADTDTAAAAPTATATATIKAGDGDKTKIAGKNLDDPAAQQPVQQQPAAAEGKAIFGDPDRVSHVILRASQTVWVNVTDAGGKVVFDHVLKAGDIYKVPDQPGMHLNTGNGSALTVTVDGQPVPKVASGSPHVVRDISLDPARLQSGDTPKGD